MTKTAKSPPRSSAPRQPGRWPLQDAEARFIALVRRVRSEGPQHVAVHGRDEVVVISAEEFRRRKEDPTGEAVIAAMQASPHRDIDIGPAPGPMPVRDVIYDGLAAWYEYSVRAVQSQAGTQSASLHRGFRGGGVLRGRLRGRARILADMIKINQIGFLIAEVFLVLAQGPGRPIPDPMHV